MCVQCVYTVCDVYVWYMLCTDMQYYVVCECEYKMLLVSGVHIESGIPLRMRIYLSEG